MKQTITTSELGGTVGEVVDAVHRRGDFYVVSNQGRPEAAIVPIGVLESYERARGRAADILDAVAAANAMAEDDAMKLALEEIAAVRAERRRRS